jgi:dTDP-4-dehydrorhamnose reductase
MKILVTGKTGQVGYELERCLQTLGGLEMTVTALDRAAMDLADPAQLRQVIRQIKPDLIVNPAAYTAVDLAESEPELAMRINGEAVAIIAEEAGACGAALIHYSTDYVFDGSKQDAYDEQDVPCPLSVYGRTKLAGDQAILDSGVPHLILRTSWVYGTHGKNFLKTIQRLAAERDTLRIVADQVGAPTWSRTIAQHTAHAIQQLCSDDATTAVGDARLKILPERWAQDGGIYHLTAQGQTSWHGFASEIVAHSSRANQVQVLPIKTEEYPVPAPRPRNSRLSCARFIDRFGVLPTWEAALNSCLREQ